MKLAAIFAAAALAAGCQTAPEHKPAAAPPEKHVAKTGVTCWTCHRGQAVPSEHWTLPEDPAHKGIVGKKNGQNAPIAASAYSSLPNDVLAVYLMGGKDAQAARVTSTTMGLAGGADADRPPTRRQGRRRAQ